MKKTISVPDSTIKWSQLWPSLNGCFWLEENKGKKQTLCVPLELKDTVPAIEEDKQIYFVPEKNQQYVEKKEKVKVAINLKSNFFKALTVSEAKKLSEKKDVYYCPIQTTSVN